MDTQTILDKVFGRLTDCQVCDVVYSVLQCKDSIDSRLKVFADTWIEDCSNVFILNSALFLTGDLEVTREDFEENLAILSQIPDLDKFEHTLFVDEGGDDYVRDIKSRYRELKEQVESGAPVPNVAYVFEAFFMQAEFGSYLVRTLAGYLRNNSDCLKDVCKDIYRSAVENYAIAQWDLEPYFEEMGLYAESSEPQIRQGDSLSIELSNYIYEATAGNEVQLTKFEEAYRLYHLLLEVTKEPAGGIFEELGIGLEGVLVQLDKAWNMPNVAKRARTLIDAWTRRKLAGEAECEAFSKTKREHEAFFEALIEADFVSKYLQLVHKDNGDHV